MTTGEWIAKFPKKLWIGTFTADIHFVPKEHEKLDCGESDGLTEFPHAIYLSQDLALTVLLESIYHEITHFVDFTTDIDDGVAEEDIADRHGKTWTLFWISNPKFQRWWNAACQAVRDERTGKQRKARRK